MKLFFLSFFLLAACDAREVTPDSAEVPATIIEDTVVTVSPRVLHDSTLLNGAERMDQLLPLLRGKRVALAGNHTSMVGKVHLADTLLRSGVNLVKLFTPEHGFRGEAGAGELVKNSVDSATGLPVVSLYGSSKKPKASDLRDVDVVLYDIQDVGARFYTYISTLHYLMEACAEQGKPVIVLDRPNPNGFYVDGPVLEKGFNSFVGMHPVPVVHGMTVAEYARMINGEGWLAGGRQVELQWVTVEDYTHDDLYQVPVAPSPNLQTMEAIWLYPSLCFFEGTDVSLGRGTDKPFMVIGHPQSDTGSYQFTPRSIKGVAANPPQEDQLCRGMDLSEEGRQIPHQANPFTLKWLITFYHHTGKRANYFIPFIEKLSGNAWLSEAIKKGQTEQEIRGRWEEDVSEFMKVREKYLLYPDFRER